MNLVQFPGLGLSFELDRVAFSIGGADIYWYGVCIAFGLCLALVFAFRRCTRSVLRGSIRPWRAQAASTRSMVVSPAAASTMLSGA